MFDEVGVPEVVVGVVVVPGAVEVGLPRFGVLTLINILLTIVIAFIGVMTWIIPFAIGDGTLLIDPLPRILIKALLLPTTLFLPTG